jgi:glycosidase
MLARGTTARFAALAGALAVAACAAPRAATDAAPPPPSDAGVAITDWRDEVLYLVMTDRFANGDPGNDTAGRADCFAPDQTRRYHGGDLAGLRDRIPYLVELGATAVWITPVYAQAGCGYHGYWADFRVPDDGAIEAKLGGVEALTALASALHGADRKLVLDMVVNHSGREAAIPSQRPDWFHDPASCETLGDPEVTCPLSGLPDFAHERADVAEYLVAQGRSLAERVAFDGVRMDTAKHVPLEFFRDAWLPGMRGVRPSLWVVAEVFDEGPVRRLGGYIDAGFDSAFQFPLRRALIDTFARGGSTALLAARMAETIEQLGSDGATWLTTFLDNHDVPRWLEETGPELAAAERLRRYRLALAALFTLPGIPQLYYGDELGLIGTGDANRRDMPAWAWSADTRAGAHAEALGDAGDTFALVQRLIAIRRRTPALARGHYAELWRPAGEGAADVFAFLRAAGASRVIVAFNNGDAEATVARIPLRDNPRVRPADKDALVDGVVLRDQLGAGAPAEIQIDGGMLELTLPARTAAIYAAP